MSEHEIEEEISEAEAQAILKAAQETMQLVTRKAAKIAPMSVVGASLSIIEATHASILAAALLSQYGRLAPLAADERLDITRDHLGEFVEMFVENGVRLIESGEMPEGMVPETRAQEPL